MRKGFTLIELMIVIAIIAIIAAIAIPNLLESRITANESQAGANLKSGLLPGMVQFQAGGYIDEDSDGIGCYADSPQHMAAGFATVGTGTGTFATGPLPSLNLALLDGKWNVAEGSAIGAYCYNVDIDQTAAVAGTATPLGLPSQGEDCRERYWAGYSAPTVYGDGGRRFFAINAGGSIYANLQSVDFSGNVLADLSYGGSKSAFGPAALLLAGDPTLANAPNDPAFFVPYQK